MKRVIGLLCAVVLLTPPATSFADNICTAYGYTPGTELYLRCLELVQRGQIEARREQDQQWNENLNRLTAPFQQPSWGWCTTPYGGVTACAR